tara:strand:+ start:36641 stop:37321 length:681 start_codon:yes stop_codon:yes gene_type:complete
MLKSFINIICIVVPFLVFSQEKDSIVYKDSYGLRIGVDLYNPIGTFIDADRKGFELVGDYRISKNYYVAAELGTIEKTREEDFINFTTNGQYIKAGIDYNAYENWLDMENSIYFGFRYGFSTFKQTLNSATLNSSPFLPQQPLDAPIIYDNLNAHWVELIIGMKVETLNNLYLGFSFSGKKMVSTKEPDNFKNLFVPGFNRVFLNNSGFGFNYTISYLIPIYKKVK